MMVSGYVKMPDDSCVYNGHILERSGDDSRAPSPADESGPLGVDPHKRNADNLLVMHPTPSSSITTWAIYSIPQTLMIVPDLANYKTKQSRGG